jgi:hypothetical protein
LTGLAVESRTACRPALAPLVNEVCAPGVWDEAGLAGLAAVPCPVETGRLPADFVTAPRPVETEWLPAIAGIATTTPTRLAITATPDAIFAVRARLARRPLASTSWARPSSGGLACADISFLNME